jgi:predicted Fe-S protein YdhL (DUF1289 family)
VSGFCQCCFYESTNTMIDRVRVVSPCISQCCLDSGDVCVGCFRSLDEIRAWSEADDRTRGVIIDNAVLRQVASQSIVSGGIIYEAIA